MRERKTQVLSRIAPLVSSEQLAFLDWLAQPVSMREPSDQKQYAKMIGVHESTLCSWKKNLDLMEGYKDLVILYLIEYEIPDCLRAMSKKAQGGSSHAFSALMEALGLVAPKEVNIKHVGVLGIIQEEITNLPENTLKLLAETVQEIQEAGE